jgi:Acyl-protein synthetase, LuxE
MELTDFIATEQFSLNKIDKTVLLNEKLNDLHFWHYENCELYKNVSDKLFHVEKQIDSIENLPYLPVSVFKNYTVKSISQDQVYKTLTSSGTTGQSPSRIYLDTDTAKLQTFSLSKIIAHVLGKSRMPMLIVDSQTVLKDKSSFSARGAGILGLSPFGKDHTYILNDNYEIDNDKLSSFLDKYNGQEIFIFGFTFMVWQYLAQLPPNKYDLSKAVLIHSGGWKKLIEISVDNNTFRKVLNEKFKLERIYNFYGMVEQVGSVFLENSQGFLQCPNFADIIIRNPVDLSVQKNGEPGLIQVISCLPKSYPGHSLLTEDIGICHGEDDAKNGWKGKYFEIKGRAKKAELRGCSDVFAINK